uniref:Translation machinery-associated protein 16 n=1 Tax=Phallusia mammillata TaxID=59560 RepID=A0A6F9DVK4_9ASCI|nr:translation machinery-associated protein 16-like [Phallusia mammillata]
MPKVTTQRSSKLIHPNSRQANHLSRLKYREQQKHNKCKEKSSKVDAKVTKFLWFKSNMNMESDKYTKADLNELIERYLERFNHELEQIEIIRSVGKRNSSQHFSRERAIKFALDQEKMQFSTSGLEIPDLINTKFVKEFKEWDGDSNMLPKLKTIRFRKQS